MSNYTDGKKALAAGEFDVAQKKLVKALDNRPDDSELWWLLMLCKFGFRNDDELKTAVRAKYEQAAETDAQPPQTPFDTSYCKNALKYATTQKRSEFVSNFCAELSEIWKQKRGKALKAPKTAVKPRAAHDVSKILLYVFIALAFASGAIGAYALFSHTTWALWTGFISLIVFSAAAFIVRSRVAKRKGVPIFADIAFISVFAALGVAVIVAGAVIDSNSVLILGIAVLVLAALIAVYRFVGGRTKDKAQSERSMRGGARNDGRYAKRNSKQSERGNKGNVYKDQDD